MGVRYTRKLIKLWTGMPGSGKTSELGEIVVSLIKRNVRYFKKTGVRRLIYVNLVLNHDLASAYGDYLRYYDDLVDLSREDLSNNKQKVRHADVVCQEISQYIDSQEYEKCPRYFKAWLRKHRHFGVDIYADTQDFLTVDNSFRRLVNSVYYCQKLIGSRDISATKPQIKYIWGLCMLREIDPKSFDEEKESYTFKTFSFQFRLITKSRCMVFDTTQDVVSPDYPPLKHIERTCPVCNKVHIQHA